MCEVNFDDAEGPAVWNETTPKARKPHRCAGCGSTIPVGTVHVRLFVVHDGSPTAERECPACTVDRNVVEDAHDSVGLMPSYLGEFLDNCIADNEPGAERWEAIRASIAARREAAKAASSC